MSPDEALFELERRYLHDAEFHARCERAVQLLEHDLARGSGRRMTDDDRSLARHAAAAALVLASIPLEALTA